MNGILLTGIIGSIILALGAAWPGESHDKPIRSIKNWLFAIGTLLMLLFAVFGFAFQAASFFFIILELYIIIATFLMMLDTDDRVDTTVLFVSGIALSIWSLYLFEGYETILFIIGLFGIGLGYAFQAGTLRRSLALMLGSAVIAYFSYLDTNWVFFWLNIFFALFSFYYVLKALWHHFK